jgi:hypothetical protein
MLKHSTSTGHVVAAGFGDLSFWSVSCHSSFRHERMSNRCYACDSYLHHLSMRPIWEAYRQLHVIKFNEPPKVKPDLIDDTASPATSAPPPAAAASPAVAAVEVKATPVAVGATTGLNGTSLCLLVSSISMSLTISAICS